MPSPLHEKPEDMLCNVRRTARISQEEAGAHFGVSRFAVSAWERNVNPPNKALRDRFIGYLWDQLRLKYNPARFEQLWQAVMVQLWGWAALTDAEHPHPDEPTYSRTYPPVPFLVDAPCA